jgi:hypothetical protein
MEPIKRHGSTGRWRDSIRIYSPAIDTLFIEGVLDFEK